MKSKSRQPIGGLWRLSALSILCCLLFSCDSANFTAEEHVARAKRFLQEKDVKANVIELKNALQKKPDLAEARWLLGKTYLELGNGQAAEKELERARSLGYTDPELDATLLRAALLQKAFQKVLERTSATNSESISAELLVIRGDAFFGTQQIDAAKAAFNRALTLQADHTGARLGLARCALAEGDPKGARAQIDTVIGSAPDNLQARLLNGQLLLSDGDFKGAEQAYSKAVELASHSFAGHIGLIRALMGQDSFDKAEQQIASLEQKVGDNPLVHSLRGNLAYRKKDLSSAKQELQQTLAKIPEHPESLLLLGNIHYEQENLEQAEKLITQFTQAMPAYLPAAKLLAIIRLRLNDPQAAIDLLIPLLGSGQEDAQFLALLGGAYLKVGNYAKGTPFLERAARLAPGSTGIQTDLALSHFATGSLEQGISGLESAAKLDPNIVRADLLLVMALIQRKKPEKAITTARQLIKKEPDNPLAYHVLGMALLSKNDSASARRQFENALGIDPSYVPSILRLAQLDQQEGHTEQAKGRYEQSLEHDPNNVNALLALSQFHLKEKDLDAALARVQQAYDHNPNALAPRLLLARHYLASKNTAKALELASETHQLAPNNPTVLLLFGQSQLAAGRPDKAEAPLKKLVELSPDSAQAHYQLGLAYTGLNKEQDARSEIGRALDIDPANLQANAALAGIEIRSGHYEKAKKIATAIKSSNPDIALGDALLGDIFAAQKEFEEAAVKYEAAFKRDRTTALAIGLHRTRLETGDTQGAHKVLERWLEERPDDAQARMVLAESYQNHGDRTQAAAHYKQVLGTLPDNVAALNNLAWLYHESGNPKALELAQRAYKGAPKAPAVLDTLGWILVQEGQTEQGIRLIKNALAAAPQQSDIRYHLAAALVETGNTSRARSELEAILKAEGEFRSKQQALELYDQIQK